MKLQPRIFELTAMVMATCWALSSLFGSITGWVDNPIGRGYGIVVAVIAVVLMRRDIKFRKLLRLENRTYEMRVHDGAHLDAFYNSMLIFVVGAFIADDLDKTLFWVNCFCINFLLLRTIGGALRGERTKG